MYAYTAPKTYKKAEVKRSKSDFLNEPVKSFVFPDIRALFNSKLHRNRELIYSEVKLEGFEIYIVEQWVAERKISSLVTCHTGNARDVISAVEVLLPLDLGKWPLEFKEYYDELIEFAQTKETERGTLFVTNLFNVPSTLNLLHIPCGDIRLIWDNFKVNFDLKRLHCGGRSALLLNAPTSAAEDKFSQLYKIPILSNTRHHHIHLTKANEQITDSDLPALHSVDNVHNDVVPCYNPVVELITIIQICLGYFNLYPIGVEKEGLIYNDTKQSIDNWWEDYGTVYFGMEKPKKEATIGPTTVASLISFVMSCYHKLLVLDCLSSKDPFDEEEFFSGIYMFQKKYGLTKASPTTYLDHLTLEKLFEVSSKNTSSDIYKLKKAVKSTVQDITGKTTNQHVANEIITTNLDVLIEHLNGGCLGLLWKSKGRLRKACKGFVHDNAFCKSKFQNGRPSDVLKNQKMIYAHATRKTKHEKTEDDLEKTSDESEAYAGGDKSVDEELFGMRHSPSSASSVSASSMVCNYDKKKFMRNYDNNRLYQDEYRRRNSIPFINDGTVDTKILENEETFFTIEKNRLHRSVSQSKVANAVENWTLPFDPSLVKMARDLLRVKQQLGSKSNTEKAAPTFVEDSLEDATFQKEEQHFSEMSAEMKIIFDKYTMNANKFNAMHENIQQRKGLIVSEIRKLDSLSSKLKYNIRTLDRRMRDVEHSVQHFDRKLNSIRTAFSDQELFSDIVMNSMADTEQFEERIKDILESQKLSYECKVMKIIHLFYSKDWQTIFSKWKQWFYNKFFKRSTVCESKKLS